MEHLVLTINVTNGFNTPIITSVYKKKKLPIQITEIVSTLTEFMNVCKKQYEFKKEYEFQIVIPIKINSDLIKHSKMYQYPIFEQYFRKTYRYFENNNTYILISQLLTLFDYENCLEKKMDNLWKEYESTKSIFPKNVNEALELVKINLKDIKFQRK